MFFVISSTKLTEILIKLGSRYTISGINLLQNDVNVFHLTWTMSLHYLVKLAVLIGRVLPLSCYRKKLQNFSHLNCDLQIRQI